MKNYEVTFNRNVKLGAVSYRKGEKATVSEEDFESLTDVIEADYKTVEVQQKPDKPKTIDEMTVAELKDYAAEHEIDLGEAKKRDELLAAIQKFEAKK